jgi:hypothetical protein
MMHELVYEIQLANLIFFVIISNIFWLLRRKSLRLECAACDTSMRHAPNPSGLSKNSAPLIISSENVVIMIKKTDDFIGEMGRFSVVGAEGTGVSGVSIG